jgi:hypothetical protein
MNHYIRQGLPIVFVSLIVLTSCSRTTVRTVGGGNGGNNNNGGGSNKCPTGLKITASDSTPVVGSDVSIHTNQDGPMFGWSGPGNYFLSANGGQDSITISGIKIIQSGWYYCTGSEPGCNSIFDSVYIDVQYQQGSPSCALTNDQMSNTAGLPDFTGGLITKSYGGSYSSIVLDASDNATEYDFVFNPNNGNSEPKDGIYYTTSLPDFDQSVDADILYVTINYFPYYLVSDDGQTVYISHVNGKLRISFCSLRADGSGAGGVFTGQLTEQ